MTRTILNITNRTGAKMELIGIVKVDNNRKECSDSKSNTVILVKILCGTIKKGQDLIFKNGSMQIHTEKICRIEENKKGIKEAQKNQAVGILLEKTPIGYLRNFVVT